LPNFYRQTLFKPTLPMKKLSLFVALLAILASCNNEEKQRCKELADENAMLRESTQTRDQQIEDITATVNDVESNLSNIEKNQSDIAAMRSQPTSENATQKDRINDMLNNINTYVAANTKKIDSLETRLQKSKVKSNGLQVLITRLRKQVAAKQMQIDTLMAQVEGLTGQVTELSGNLSAREQELQTRNSELATRTQELSAKDTELNRAFFAVGTKKELLKQGIMLKEGGVLGLGKSKSVNNNLDNSKFRELSIKNTSDIEVGVAKKPVLVSRHPSGSYTFLNSDGKVTLKITDPAKFWSQTRYAVVEVDK
jgi:DNA repair exonuclease SbcCD ATPase subunit